MTYDSDSFTGSIGNGNTETLSVACEDSDYVYLTLDDGTETNNPAQYTLELFKQTLNLGRRQLILEETTQTSRSFRFEAAGRVLEVDITNTSGSSTQYEMELESRE